jgi:carbon storage regulator CsrA
MLIIKRKIGESVLIGKTSVLLKERRGNIVMLAIDAPDDVRVQRGEIANGASGQERDQENATPRSQNDCLPAAIQESK